MSRAYKVEVSAKGISPKELLQLMTKQFGWEEVSLWEYWGIVEFVGEGSLYGGQSEEEAHEEICKALKAINPAALVSTRWTYMEELPYSRYGDDLDIDAPLAAPTGAAAGTAQRPALSAPAVAQSNTAQEAEHNNGK